MAEHLHWHEGLFLQPHHLQLQQRNQFLGLARERRMLNPYPYGVIQARLSVDDLENHRVRFEKLHVVLPGGLHFRFPEEADLGSLEIKSVFSSKSDDFTVYLALPLWQEERANSIESNEGVGKRIKALYRVAEAEVPDENTGTGKQPVQYRRLNGFLMLEDEDFTDLEFIPLLRISRQLADVGAGLPRLDPEYVPPTYLMRGTPVLTEMVRDLTSQVMAVHGGLAEHLASSTLDMQALAGIQFEQMTRLRVLGRFAAKMEPELAAGGLTVFETYLELRVLLAELASLFPGRRDFDAPEYDHDDPYPCFSQLCQRIRGYLRGAVKPSFRKVDFVYEDGVYVGDVSPALFQGGLAFFLGIETNQDALALSRMVHDTDLFKLMPASFGVRAIRGIALSEERHPPLELPMKAKLFYYRLDTEKSQRIWEQFVKEPQCLVHFDAPNLQNYKISLYVTVPPDSQ